MYFALVTSAAAALATAAPTPPQMLNNQEVFTGEDYPSLALDRNEQGNVGVTLQVDATGAVTSCRVTKSSGSTSLDEQTCALYRARARFEPARDSRGRPQRSHYSTTIKWAIAEDDGPPPMPRQPWQFRTEIALSKDGQVLDCKTVTTGLPNDPPDCAVMMAFVKQRLGQPSPTARASLFSISQVTFYPVDPAKAPLPPKLTDATQVAQQVSRVTVAADGQITACEGVRFTGEIPADQDACSNIRKQRFVAGAGELVGTIVITLYRRTESVA